MCARSSSFDKGDLRDLCNVSSKVVLVFPCKPELSIKAGDVWISISIKLFLSDSVVLLHDKPNL